MKNMKKTEKFTKSNTFSQVVEPGQTLQPVVWQTKTEE